jgi:hypothetical protein
VNQSTSPDDAATRNQQAAHMLRTMLGTGVLDIPAVIRHLEGNKP